MNHRASTGTALIIPKPKCPRCGSAGGGCQTLPQFYPDGLLPRGELQRLADKTGVDKSILSRMFSGQSVPPLATIVLVAEALGVTESTLIHHPPIWHRLMEKIGDGEQ